MMKDTVVKKTFSYCHDFVYNIKVLSRICKKILTEGNRVNKTCSILDYYFAKDICYYCICISILTYHFSCFLFYREPRAVYHPSPYAWDMV